MSDAVTVLIHHRSHDDDTMLLAYRKVSDALTGVPGMLGNELMQSTADTGRFVVASHWSDLDAFKQWEEGESHKPTTAALRPYRDTEIPRPFEILLTRAAFGQQGAL